MQARDIIGDLNSVDNISNRIAKNLDKVARAGVVSPTAGGHSQGGVVDPSIGTGTGPVQGGHSQGSAKPQPSSPRKACIGSEDDKCCKTTGVTDEGIINSSKWKTIISAALTAYNTIVSLKMAGLQRDIAERYLKLAEEYTNYYNTNYKPLEVSTAKEALNLELYKRDKEQLYTGQMLMSVRGKYAGRVDSAMSCTGRYCTGQRAALMNDMLLEQATVESMTAGYGHRYTDREEIIHNTLRWEKRRQVMNVGRDIPVEAISFASLATGAFGRLGDQAGKAAEGAMKFLAYNLNRGDTRYPERRGPLEVSQYEWIPTKLEAVSVNQEQKPKFKLAG